MKIISTGLALSLSLVACDDTMFPSHGGEAGGIGWCAAQSLFSSECIGCHSASAALGGLDLESDPHAALVSVSSSYGTVLVVPGDPDGSLLLHKLEGPGTDEGGPMPPTGGIDADLIASIRAWIADGADEVCDEEVDPGGGGYHPDGWSDPGVHGIEAKFGAQDCRTCHGEAFDGGTVGISCASCHDASTPDWTTTCTFCHGDPERLDEDIPALWAAAPPQDIDDNNDPETISFPAHELHLRSPLHADWDCELCHVVPTDVFSPGHVFVDDGTKGRADMTFSGLAAGATFSDKTCADVYCHGNGRSDGSVETDDSVSCGECHGLGDSLSPPHEAHLDEEVQCAECHPTVDLSENITIKEMHLDGAVTLALPSVMARNEANETCTGTCHGEPHNGRQWIDD